MRISTHTPLAGRDVEARAGIATLPISTHTPLAGRDPQEEPVEITEEIFLLTRPSRGATGQATLLHWIFQISTHTPLAGRDYNQKQVDISFQISTHTPLAGRDRNMVVN